MYEYLGQFKPVYTMELPNAQSPAGLELWTKEIIKLKEKLESFFEVTITEEQVREQVKIMNNVRRAMKEFYSLTLPEPVPVLGQDLFKVLYGSSFKFDKKRLPEAVSYTHLPWLRVMQLIPFVWINSSIASAVSLSTLYWSTSQ